MLLPCAGTDGDGLQRQQCLAMASRFAAPPQQVRAHAQNLGAWWGSGHVSVQCVCPVHVNKPADVCSQALRKQDLA